MEEELIRKIRYLKEVLETKGVSDSGREYRVYSFSSAHVADTRLQDALEDLFKTIGDENE